ncbi:DUF2975 domain-containing protein [Corynebacterium pacaense]|uniref:DUF2975 domain-containing protein n=1 Tax=Corynebacterium pacaense TaxID=1816684 RepID=UPI0015C4539B|nr:DUF2975 domain-containing protein [Corynebacterium pacaense]
MTTRIVILLRVVLAVGFMGCLGIQALLIASVFLDPTDSAGAAETAVVAILVIGLICVEVAMVCVWQLLILVGRGTVFSPAAFRWVDHIIRTIGIAAILVLILGYIVGEIDDAPGVILIGAVPALLVAGVAMLVYVQRMLLVQAVGFSTELEAVI